MLPDDAQTPLPIFVAPAGLARLGHPDGEQNIVRGVAPHNILQVVSSGASCSIDEIFAVKEPDQNLAWQFYVNSDKTIAEQKLKKALELGAKAIFVTVDVPVLGKRERDLKLKARSQNYEHPIAAVSSLSYSGSATRRYRALICHLAPLAAIQGGGKQGRGV